jgi:hypothetical protein
MTTSESTEKIAEALVLAQRQMLPLIKDSANPFFRSKYADLQAVTEACYPALQANGICVIQSAEAGEHSGLNIKTRLLHSSGQFIETDCVIPPAGQDPQKYGSAVTYGRRYGLQAAMGLAAVDDDGEGAMNRNAAKPASTPSPKPAPKPAPAKAEPGKDEAMADKIVAAFWEQVDVDSLNAKMAKAKGAGYGAHPKVIEAYEELKIKLS